MATTAPHPRGGRLVLGATRTSAGRVLSTQRTSWRGSGASSAAETPYLKFLRGIPGSQFVVATEPWDIADSPYWPWLLGKAHGTGGCATSIASQTARYRVGVLPSKNTPGVDFYPHLNIPASASQQTVTAGWEASMNMVPLWVRARTTLDEEGIRATAGAYQHPEDLEHRWCG